MILDDHPTTPSTTWRRTSTMRGQGSDWMGCQYGHRHLQLIVDVNRPKPRKHWSRLHGHPPHAVPMNNPEPTSCGARTPRSTRLRPTWRRSPIASNPICRPAICRATWRRSATYSNSLATHHPHDTLSCVARPPGPPSDRTARGQASPLRLDDLCDSIAGTATSTGHIRPDDPPMVTSGG